LELLILPLILGLVMLILPSGWCKLVGGLGSLASLGIACYHLMGFDPLTQVVMNSSIDKMAFGLTLNFGYDSLGLVMIMLTNAIIPLILLSNWNRELAGNKLFTALVFFMQLGLLGVFTAQDGIMFYIFWEFTLLPIFLILYWFGAKENNKVLFKFFIYTLVGSLAMLLSFIALGINAQSFAYQDLVNVQLSQKMACWVMSGFLLAFAIKIPLFPFHTWQPATYTSSPMAGTMLLSALMLKMALYGMMKWMLPLTSEGIEIMKWPIIILGAIGIVYGAVIAIKQNDIKTLFAFASISHLGLIAAGIMVFNTAAWGGAIIQIINHSLISIGLFLAADILEKRTGTRKLDELGGIAKIAPRFGFWFAAIVFAALSIPFSAGFIGEFILIKELFSFHTLIGILAVSSLILGAVYMLRSYQLSMFGPPKLTSFQDLTWNETAVFVILSISVLIIGLFSTYIIDYTAPAIRVLTAITPFNQLIIE
jgi:NADH-quinone oxidoreductase subunit M